MAKRIKIAIVGAGRWGKNLLGEFSKQADVTSVYYKGSPETEAFLRENYPDVRRVTSFADILEDPSIEAVAVATPTLTHFEFASASLMSGKHVFLEKPGGKGGDEMSRMAKIAHEKKLILALGYEFIHHPAVAKIVEMLADRKIRSLHFEWHKWGTFSEHPVTNLFCHDASLMAALGVILNKVESYEEFGAVTDADVVSLRLSSEGVSITARINRVSPEKRKSVTVIADGICLAWINDDLYRLASADQKPEHVDIKQKQTPVSAEIADFLGCVRDGGTPIANASLGTTVWKMLELVKR